MSSKLTEKSLKALEDLGKKDGELGLATPTMLLTDNKTESQVKAEYPSLEAVKEALKSNKNTYVFIHHPSARPISSNSHQPSIDQMYQWSSITNP